MPAVNMTGRQKFGVWTASHLGTSSPVLPNSLLFALLLNTERKALP